MELPQDAPNFSWNKNATPIAGIVRDFQQGNITDDTRPAMLRIDKRSELYPWSILIEVEGNPYTAYKKYVRSITKCPEDWISMLHFWMNRCRNRLKPRYVPARSYLFCRDSYLDIYVGLAGYVDLFYPATFTRGCYS